MTANAARGVGNACFCFCFRAVLVGASCQIQAGKHRALRVRVLLPKIHIRGRACPGRVTTNHVGTDENGTRTPHHGGSFVRSHRQGTPSFLPGGRKRQRALTQCHSTNETDTRLIYSHYRSPLAPYDLVVVLPLPRMGGSCACGEGGSRAASACGAAGTLPCSAASCLARLTACLRTRSRPCAHVCACGARTWLVSPSVWRKQCGKSAMCDPSTLHRAV